MDKSHTPKFLCWDLSSRWWYQEVGFGEDDQIIRGEPLWMKWEPYIKETPETTLAPTAVWGQLSTNQEAGHHQTLKLPVPSLKLPSLPKREKQMSDVYKPCDLWLSVTAAWSTKSSQSDLILGWGTWSTTRISVTQDRLHYTHHSFTYSFIHSLFLIGTHQRQAPHWHTRQMTSKNLPFMGGGWCESLQSKSTRHQREDKGISTWSR